MTHEGRIHDAHTLMHDEIEEIPEDIRDGLIFHPVSTMDQVLAHALRPASAVAQAEIAAVVTH